MTDDIKTPKKHKAGPGRPKGMRNKLTQTAKEAFEFAFNDMGGGKALAAWARSNETDFYKLFARLIPVDTNHTGSVSHTVSWPLSKTALDRP